MRKIVAGLLIAYAPCAAHAQSRSFDFKGMKQTDTLAMHRPEFSQCDKYYLAQGCRPKDTTVGGVDLFDYVVLFSDNDSGVSQIRGDFLATSYDTLVEAFTMKWGKPDKSSTSTVQNGFGATLEVPSAQWNFAEGMIQLRGGDFKGIGHMQFMSTAEAARIGALEKPKVDF